MDQKFIQQGDVRRTLQETMSIAWELLASLPDESLVRLSDQQIAAQITCFRDD